MSTVIVFTTPLVLQTKPNATNSCDQQEFFIDSPLATLYTSASPKPSDVFPPIYLLAAFRHRDRKEFLVRTKARERPDRSTADMLLTWHVWNRISVKQFKTWTGSKVSHLRALTIFW